MSKESKSRDRWRQLGQAQYGDWCSGCGLHLPVTGEHRADCTTLPPPCPHCLYYPAVNDGRHRADCPHRDLDPPDAIGSYQGTRRREAARG